MAKPTIRKAKGAPAAPVPVVAPAAAPVVTVTKHVAPVHQPASPVTTHLKRYHLIKPFKLQ